MTLCTVSGEQVPLPSGGRTLLGELARRFIDRARTPKDRRRRRRYWAAFVSGEMAGWTPGQTADAVGVHRNTIRPALRWVRLGLFAEARAMGLTRDEAIELLRGETDRD